MKFIFLRLDLEKKSTLFQLAPVSKHPSLPYVAILHRGRTTNVCIAASICIQLWYHITFYSSWYATTYFCNMTNMSIYLEFLYCPIFRILVHSTGRIFHMFCQLNVTTLSFCSFDIVMPFSFFWYRILTLYLMSTLLFQK